jgi:hypothetical protein
MVESVLENAESDPYYSDPYNRMELHEMQTRHHAVVEEVQQQLRLKWGKRRIA